MRDEEKIEILDKALEMIEANPKHWDQNMWHCGTSHCLAGFCDLVIKGISSEQVPTYNYSKVNSNFADNNQNLRYLFRANNDLDYIKKNIQHLKNTQIITGVDLDGIGLYPTFRTSVFTTNT